MAAIVTIRNWVRDVLEGLTPESRPDDKFRESIGENLEPLESMPKDDLFHRSFRVINNRDGVPRDNFLPLEVEATLTIQIGYMGQQDDDAIEQWMDEDEELIKRHLLQRVPTPNFPTELCNINFISADAALDLSEGGRNIMILPINYRVHYQLEAV